MASEPEESGALAIKGYVADGVTSEKWRIRNNRLRYIGPHRLSESQVDVLSAIECLTAEVVQLSSG